jgi:ABC-type glutathione transport system ATPase component
MSLLELKNLTLTYPGTEEPAVDSISLQMEQGEILALVGGKRMRQILHYSDDRRS